MTSTHIFFAIAINKQLMPLQKFLQAFSVFGWLYTHIIIITIIIIIYHIYIALFS